MFALSAAVDKRIKVCVSGRRLVDSFCGESSAVPVISEIFVVVVLGH